MEGFDMRAVMPCYQLSNLLLYKHELLLSKCPLTADWLLIRPLWNEISNEPLNYGSNTEHIISCTYIRPVCLIPPVFFCLGSFYLLSLFCLLLPLWLHMWLLHLIFRLLFLLQSATAAGGQKTACLTWSSTAAPAVGGAVWAAETTPTGPTVSTAEQTTTGNLPRSPAYPATAILMVICRLKKKLLNVYDNKL